MGKVLIVGNGSIGKQHTNAVLELGYKPIVVTKYPGSNNNVDYIPFIDEDLDLDTVIICTPTQKHYNSFKLLIKNKRIKRILLEKPVASTTSDALKIKKLTDENNLQTFVAFDMRFIPHLQYVRKNIGKIFDKIRIVKISCGQYLPEWRPDRDYRESYSSKRALGGGVDLDLTHEIDYMLWLFGMPTSIDFVKTYKISTLDIDSPDYFKGIYNYGSFIVDIELDYFRKLERKLIIIGENETLVELDFIKKTLIFDNKRINISSETETILLEDEAFLNMDKDKVLCTLNEAIDVLKMIKR